MGKCRTKAIQTDLGIIRHNQAYPELFWHIQAYCIVTPCVTLTYLELWYIQNPDTFRTRSIFRTLAYSQPWYIQSPGILRTLVYLKSQEYPEPCQTSTMRRFAKIVNGYNYFHKS